MVRQDESRVGQFCVSSGAYFFVTDERANRGRACETRPFGLHVHPYYWKTYGYRAEDFPVASREFERYLSLPIFPGMTGAQIDYVIENVLEIVKDAAR